MRRDPGKKFIITILGESIAFIFNPAIVLHIKFDTKYSRSYIFWRIFLAQQYTRYYIRIYESRIDATQFSLHRDTRLLYNDRVQNSFFECNFPFEKTCIQKHTFTSRIAMSTASM